jgi:hypothetical protein
LLVVADPPPHGPFDPIHIAEAGCDGLSLVTGDGAFGLYGADVVW